MDYTAVRECVEEMGIALAELGWTKPMQIIEGNTKVGAAVRDCRGDDKIRLVKDALKGWAKEVKAMPGGGKKNAMVEIMNNVWECFKVACDDGLDDPPQRSSSGGRSMQTRTNNLRIQS